jgi:ABC-type bacteriocin/lantibiotic exporter with double-glycine peptidase domain
MLTACESYFSGPDPLPDNVVSSYFIKEGRVSEAGTHDELLSLRGDYYEYVQLQALNK